MKAIRQFAAAWVLMWSLSYIMVAIVAPFISDVAPLVYGTLGVWLAFTLLLQHLAYDKLGRCIVRMLWVCNGVLMVYGGITSWTGVAVWNVPFPNKEVFQVSMALADLLSAVLMFSLALSTDH